jgi:hypothetical protein
VAGMVGIHQVDPAIRVQVEQSLELPIVTQAR